jgi:hypothetical protein
MKDFTAKTMINHTPWKERKRCQWSSSKDVAIAVSNMGTRVPIARKYKRLIQQKWRKKWQKERLVGTPGQICAQPF